MSVQAITCAFAAKGLEPSEKLVLLCLANYADNKMSCWPSQSTICEDTGLSPRTVQNAMRSLETRGVLKTESRRRAGGSRATNLYTLYFVGEVTPRQPAAIADGQAATIAASNRQPLPMQPAITAGLTTFEPSLEPRAEANASGLAVISGGSPPDDGAIWDVAVLILTTQGGMTPKAARSLFGRLLSEHKLLARDLVGPLAECSANGTQDPQGFLTKAAQVRGRRRTEVTPVKRAAWT